MKFFTVVLLTSCLFGFDHAASALTHAQLDGAKIHRAAMAPLNTPTLVLLTCGEAVIGGQMMGCEAWLTHAANTETTFDVVLLGTSPNVAKAPLHITMPAGERKRVIPIATSPVTQPTPITVQVSYEGESLAATRTVLPPGLEKFRVTHSQIVGGGTTSMQITLTGPAPAGGLPVNIKSSREDVVPVPQTLIVPANARTFTVELPSRPVARATTVMLSVATPNDDRTLSYPLHVTKESPPDLVIGNWSYKDADGPIAQMPRGRPFELCVDVINRSLATVPASRLRLIMLTSTGQDLSLEAPIASLPAGGAAQPCFALPALDPALQYTFNMYADYGNALREADETNNVRAFGSNSGAGPSPREPTPKPAPAPLPAPAARPSPAAESI